MEQGPLIFFVGAVLLLVASGVLAWGVADELRQRAAIRRRIQRILGRTTPHGAPYAGGGVWGQRLGLWDSELERLVSRAGLTTRRARRVITAVVLTLPMAGTVTGVAAGWAVGGGGGAFVAALAGFAVGFLLPRYALRWKAAARYAALRRETPLLVHCIRMLLDAGLSVEHTLRVARTEGGKLLPELSKELDRLMSRIDVGADLGDELKATANELDVPEFTDLATALRQVSRQGGNIRDSLVKLTHLMDDRRQSELQEQVGKLSGKMSIVMMLFLFPALVIFVAGPGFLAVMQALRSF